MDYWKECIETAFEEANLPATKAQIESIAETVEGAHENYGMAFGHDVASQNFSANQEREKKNLVDELKREREKVTCRECNGYGSIRSDGPCHYSVTSCWKCHGDGRHSL